MSLMADAIRDLTGEGVYTKDAIKTIIESMLKSAYKRTFNTDENAIVKFNDDMSDVSLYSRKEVVDGVYNPVTEIELEDAKKLSADCEIGDEIDLLIDPKTFERSAIATSRQNAKKGLSETKQEHLYEEYKDRVGQIVTGTFIREHKGSIYIEVGKVEGIIPHRYQSPREEFKIGDRIKAYCTEARKSSTADLQLVLSRTAPELVRSVMEVEVPEIADGTVEIVKIVREAGYRSKVALTAHKEDVDPVGACVGQRGSRIQNIINELGGERLDVLEYSNDPVQYIKNALSPAQVLRVVITDEEKRNAIAIVADTQFSLAIGTKGQNVRLANRLVDWVIDVKTSTQCADIDLSMYDTRKAAENLFNTNTNNSGFEDSNKKEHEAIFIKDITLIDLRLQALLHEAGIDTVEQYLAAKKDDIIKGISGITKDDIDNLANILENKEEKKADNITKIEEPKENVATPLEETEEEEEYFCPECGQKITLDMTKCPNCGVEFTFEEE